MSVHLKPHIPTLDCAQQHCFSHHVDEPVLLGKFYKVCAECNHMFATEQDLISDYIEMLKEMKLLVNSLITSDAIYCCPHCIHDF